MTPGKVADSTFRLWRYLAVILCLLFGALGFAGVSARVVLCVGLPPLIAGVWFLAFLIFHLFRETERVTHSAPNPTAEKSQG
jgi:hypothetical protein